jgi:hypothetical protein
MKMDLGGTMAMAMAMTAMELWHYCSEGGNGLGRGKMVSGGTIHGCGYGYQGARRRVYGAGRRAKGAGRRTREPGGGLRVPGEGLGSWEEGLGCREEG